MSLQKPALVLNIFSIENLETVDCVVAEKVATFIIDSGSPVCTITEHLWSILNKSMVTDINLNCKRKFVSYGQTKPLTVVAEFKCEIEIRETNRKSTEVVFVIKEARNCLLGKSSAERLDVLRIGVICKLDERDESKKFPKIPNLQVKFHIDKSVPGVRVPYIRCPISRQDLYKRKILEYYEAFIFEFVPQGVEPEFICQLLSVEKKDPNDLRLVLNMKNVNKAIIRQQYPMPVIEDIIPKVAGCTKFSVLDLKMAFFHIELHPSARPYTAFMTPYGLMQSTRLTNGGSNSNEIFQSTMDERLGDLNYVAIFVDDMMVGGRDQEEHDERLASLKKRLKENNLTVNEEKSVENKDQVDFIGFTFNQYGISPSRDKVDALSKMKHPTNLEELRSFLGLITYQCHFIPHFSNKTEPLRRLLKKGEFKWEKEQDLTFKALVGEFTKSVRTLGYFDKNDKTKLVVDAGPNGLGGVLVQTKNGVNRVISCISKSLTDTEKAYPQPHKEALAAVWGMEKLDYYLIGLKFKLCSDLQAFEFLYANLHQGNKRSMTRAQGWLLRCMAFDFDIEYVKSEDNIADPLSRLCDQIDAEFNDDSKVFLCALEIEPESLSLKEIISEMEEDEELKSLKVAILTGKFSKDQMNYHAMKHQLAIIAGVITKENKIIIPKSLIGKALKVAHSSHCGASMMKSTLRKTFWWKSVNADIDEYAKQCLACAQVANLKRPQPIQRSELPDRTWEYVSIDFLKIPGILGEIMIVVDSYSRHISAEIVSSTSFDNVMPAVNRVCQQWGYFARAKCDNGPPFDGEKWKDFCDQFDIKYEFSPPRTAQSNGGVEIQNKGLVRRMKTAVIENDNLKVALKSYIFDYNTRPNTVTGAAPLDLMTNRTVRGKFPVLDRDPSHSHEQIQSRDEDAKMKGKIYADDRRHAEPSDLNVGDSVLMQNFKKSNKLEPNYTAEEYKIIAKNSSVEFVIQNADKTKTFRRHPNALKKWNFNNEAEMSPNPSAQLPSSSSHHTQQLLKPSLHQQLDHSPTHHLPTKTTDTTSRQIRARKPTKRLIEEIKHINDDDDEGLKV